jgi:hypothetical protein
VRSDTFPFLADVPFQRTVMVALGGASAWAELLTAVGMWLPVAGVGLGAAAFLAAHRRALALPVAAFSLALAAQLLALARIVTPPLYHAAIAPGTAPPWVLDSLTRALQAAFTTTLLTGSALVVVAILAHAHRFSPIED